MTYSSAAVRTKSSMDSKSAPFLVSMVKSRHFLGEESVSWGGNIVCETQRAIWDCKRALIIVSNGLLPLSGTLNELVVSALINRQSSKGNAGLLLPALIDVDQEEFKRHFPLLAVYKTVDASLEDPAGLARLVQDHLGLQHIHSV